MKLINDDETRNEWFENNQDIKIIEVKENISPSGNYKITSIYYIKEGRKEKLENINNIKE